MYSMVMMLAMTTAPETPNCHRPTTACYGCYGGCYGTRVVVVNRCGCWGSRAGLYAAAMSSAWIAASRSATSIRRRSFCIWAN